jgi:hypothetical protein
MIISLQHLWTLKPTQPTSISQGLSDTKIHQFSASFDANEEYSHRSIHLCRSAVAAARARHLTLLKLPHSQPLSEVHSAAFHHSPCAPPVFPILYLPIVRRLLTRFAPFLRMLIADAGIHIACMSCSWSSCTRISPGEAYLAFCVDCDFCAFPGRLFS